MFLDIVFSLNFSWGWVGLGVVILDGFNASSVLNVSYPTPTQPKLVLRKHPTRKVVASHTPCWSFPELFTGRDRARGSRQEVIQISRVESGRVRRCLKYHGTGRAGSGPVGSRGFQISRVGAGYIP